MTRSFKTQVEIKAIFYGLVTLFCLGFVGTPVARASEVDQALQDWSKAQSDFYKGLQANPEMTPQQKAALAKQTLNPASQNLSSAINRQTAKTVKEITRSRPKGKLAGQSKSDPGAKPTSTPQAEVRQDKPEEALDGSNVPREIEFSGPKKPNGLK
ncbi:hypothetical protein WDW37_14660 [Bdellovibrionota bacterium FG-1]